MRCFQHFEREALGSCVNCGKGVCLDCLNKVQGKIYCSGCDSASGSVHQGTSLQMSFAGGARLSSQPYASATIYSNKNRFLAALLAFFVGTFGVHKFYLNQAGWGFLYLAFCWTGIPSLASCVEGILYLVRSDADFVQRYGQVMLPSFNAAPQLMQAAPSLPSTAKEYEKFLLQYAQQHQGQISLAHLMTEYELRLDKVEDALARLSAKGVVVSNMDDSGHIRYFVPEFRPQ